MSLHLNDHWLDPSDHIEIALATNQPKVGEVGGREKETEGIDKRAYQSSEGRIPQASSTRSLRRSSRRRLLKREGVQKITKAVRNTCEDFIQMSPLPTSHLDPLVTCIGVIDIPTAT